MAKRTRKAAIDRSRLGQADRTFVEAPVMLRAPQGGAAGIACDVSESGIKVVVDKPPALGPVSVKLVGLPSFPGEICWRTNCRVGVRLSRPLAPEVLADWIKYHGSGRR